MLPNIALASVPWARARGEAVELRRSTKDLRNRLERLFPYSPAAQCAVAMDEQAKWLIRATTQPLSPHEFELTLNNFAQTLDQTRAYVASDYRVVTDSGVIRYLEQSNSRFDRFVADLRRAKLPAIPYPVAPQPVFQHPTDSPQAAPYCPTVPRTQVYAPQRDSWTTPTTAIFASPTQPRLPTIVNKQFYEIPSDVNVGSTQPFAAPGLGRISL